MTTLLQEFEEYLKTTFKPNEDYALAIHHCQNFLEELKKKHNIT